MGRSPEHRRLRDDDYMYEPIETESRTHVRCDFCGEEILRKKAKKYKGSWECKECRTIRLSS